jgi:S-adenosylmethionine:tRNA ribosyltransferase-isomerase
MIAADRPDRRFAKLVIIDRNGRMRHLPRAEQAFLFSPGDLVIANDAATLPASLQGTHCASGEPIEVRLAAWVVVRDPTRFVAIAFGAGDHRTRTENRPPPPPLSPTDRLSLGPLIAVIERLLDHPRLFRLRFLDNPATILKGLARHGQPIQYAHVPEPLALYDIWTKIAADPIAFEPPSAGFALDWRTLAAWRKRGIGFATLTHAAGISSTGDRTLDLRLPFDEPYSIPERTAAAIKQAKSKGGRIIAIGTTVVRAIESAGKADGSVRAGTGVAKGRIARETRLRVVDAILTGVHEPGESHFELLRAFASDAVLDQTHAALLEHGYRTHEFGDSMLIERQCAAKSGECENSRATKKGLDTRATVGGEQQHATRVQPKALGPLTQGGYTYRAHSHSCPFAGRHFEVND